MTDELSERVLRIVGRSVTHALSAAETLAFVGGRMKTPPVWGRHAEMRQELENAQAALRNALALVGCAVELLDGEESKTRAA